MGKQKYQMDFSFLEDYDNSTTHYQPFDLLATPKCVPMMVMCSKKPEPAAWSIIGVMYSVHFLHYKDMEDYITSHGLTRWTDEHDRKSGLCLSGISNHCRIFQAQGRPSSLCLPSCLTGGQAHAQKPHKFLGY